MTDGPRAEITGRVALRFGGESVRTGNHVNLSAVRTEGEHLWLAGDETASIERLVLDSASAPTTAGAQRTFALADLVELPGPADGEADIEGIARAGGHLWAIGSHSLVRKKVKPKHDAAKALRRLATVRHEANRFVIARLAVQDGPDGRPELVRTARDGRRSALCVDLADALRDDPHLGPFLAIPSKDNGLDVEGLAVHGDRLYVGLRGPVLRGWAVVLELLPRDDPDDPGRFVLGELDGARHRLHVLELGGLGVRDLCPDGDDLLVLAGPSMALSGPVRVYRWHGAAGAAATQVVRSAELTVEVELPHGAGEDHAEGIALLADPAAADRLPDPGRLLVVHDSPSADRRPAADVVLADRVRIGRPFGAPGTTPASP